MQGFRDPFPLPGAQIRHETAPLEHTVSQRPFHANHNTRWPARRKNFWAECSDWIRGVRAFRGRSPQSRLADQELATVRAP